MSFPQTGWKRGDSLQCFAFTPWILILAAVTQAIYQAAVVSMLSLRRMPVLDALVALFLFHVRRVNSVDRVPITKWH